MLDISTVTIVHEIIGKCEKIMAKLGNFIFVINFKLHDPFLLMGFNCLKNRAISRSQFTFYH